MKIVIELVEANRKAYEEVYDDYISRDTYTHNMDAGETLSNEDLFDNVKSIMLKRATDSYESVAFDIGFQLGSKNNK